MEACSELVTQPREMPHIPRVHSAGGLDLDPDHTAGGRFEDEVDLAGLVGMPQVMGTDGGNREFQKWPKLSENERVDQSAEPISAPEGPGATVPGQVGGQPAESIPARTLPVCSARFVM